MSNPEYITSLEDQLEEAEQRLATLRARVEQFMDKYTEHHCHFNCDAADSLCNCGAHQFRAQLLALLTREADPEIPRSPSPYDLDAEARLRRQGG